MQVDGRPLGPPSRAKQIEGQALWRWWHKLTHTWADEEARRLEQTREHVEALETAADACEQTDALLLASRRAGLELEGERTMLFQHVELLERELDRARAQHDEMTSELETEQTRRAESDLATINARAEGESLQGELRAEHERLVSMQAELVAARATIDTLKSGQEALLVQANTLAHQVIALQPLEPRNAELSAELQAASTALEASRAHVAQLTDEVRVERLEARRAVRLAEELKQSEALRMEALRLHAAACDEKAVQLGELQALRRANEGNDVLRTHNLVLQSELLSLRGQHALLEAQLSSVEYSVELAVASGAVVGKNAGARCGPEGHDAAHAGEIGGQIGG